MRALAAWWLSESSIFMLHESNWTDRYHSHELDLWACSMATRGACRQRFASILAMLDPWAWQPPSANLLGRFAGTIIRRKRGGAAVACWAHNPEVGGSKPLSAILFIFCRPQEFTHKQYHTREDWTKQIYEKIVRKLAVFSHWKQRLMN